LWVGRSPSASAVVTGAGYVGRRLNVPAAHFAADLQ
jgi:hypothetical protein